MPLLSRRMIVAAIFASAVLSGWPPPALAATPSFLPGSRIGLVPPEGMVPSRAFQGYEDASKGAMLFVTELGANTAEQVAKDFTPEALAAGGIEVETREDVALAGMHGYLVVAHQDVAGMRWRKWALVQTRDDITAIIVLMTSEAAREAYPDAVLRASFASLALRESVPDEEKFGLLPYRFGDLAGFHLVQAIPTGTAILTSGPSDATIATSQPFFMIGLAASAPAPAEWESFARRRVATIGGLDQFHVLQVTQIRFGPDFGQEIVAEGKDPKNGVELSLVQWMHFRAGGYMEMVGIARRDVWAEAFPRMRMLRDGIEFK